jgi:hypothetical protein
MTILSDFIRTERELYANNDNNLFAFSLSQALRYYEFILIIANRHKEVSQKMVLNSMKLMESITAQNIEAMTDEQIHLYTEGPELATLVHLEIESFYLFAKTLLDKVALFLQNYFGQARGISLISHDKLTKSYDQYRIAKGLVYPSGFSESLQFLKEHVCDYRDKQISHLQNPRTNKGTIFSASGQTRIVAVPFFPNPNEIGIQIESSELPELLSSIDTYIQLVITVIELNRAKTRFRLKE